jgi:hypothetical protein
MLLEHGIWPAQLDDLNRREWQALLAAMAGARAMGQPPRAQPRTVAEFKAMHGQ